MKRRPTSPRWPNIEISPWMPVFLLAYAWLDPLHSFLPFLGAATAHEAGHIAAALLCGGRIIWLRLAPGGARMALSPMPWGKEVLCALAGPLAGLLLAAACPLPAVRFWALIHSLWNLLPVPPLDGSRALALTLLAHMPADRAMETCRWVAAAVLALVLFAGLYAMFFLHWGAWAMLPGVLLLIRKKC